MTDPRDDHFIPAVHALHLAELVPRWGVSAEQLLEGLGLDVDQLSDPKQRVSIPVVERMVARAKQLTGEPGLGFYVGLKTRASTHGYVGYAAMASSTLGEALEVAVRFAPTRTNAIALRVHREGAMASLVLTELVPLGAATDVLVFALLVGVAEIGKALTGQPMTGGAEVAFPAPPGLTRFDHLIRGGLRFDQPAHRLVFDAAQLDLPLVMADPVALRLASEQCEKELDQLGYASGIAAKVRGLLTDEGGRVTALDEAAARLGMSARTVKRRLSAEGTDFTSLLDEHRRDRATLLLRSTDLSVDALAERLGYSDVANFTRAFRRWTGTTPTAFRKTGGGGLTWR